MPLGAVETCGSIRWRQRLIGEKGGQRIIRRGELRRQITLPLEPQGLAPELLEKVGVEISVHRIIDGMSQSAARRGSAESRPLRYDLAPERFPSVAAEYGRRVL